MHREKLYISITYSFINKLLDLAPPVLVAWSIDTVTGKTPWLIKSIAGNNPLALGLTLGGLAVFIFAFEGIFEYLYNVGFRTLAQRVQHQLRLDTYAAMQKREMAFFESHRVGETMAILSDDINQLENFLNTVFNQVVQILALFIIAAVILLSASPALSMWAIVPIPIIVWGSLWFQKILTPRYKLIREAVGHVSTRLENNLGGIAVIKSFTAEDFEQDRLARVSEEYRDRNLATIKVSALFVPLIRMGVALGFGGILVLGALWTFEGKITAGTFTLFGMMSQRILWPLTNLGTILDNTERCRASAARIFGLLDTKPRIIDSPSAKPLQFKNGRIEFNKVIFGYSPDKPILNNLTLTIPAGATVGIAGTTGAGKSTLVKLILRLYDPNSGNITIDGQNLREVQMTSLREHIALVSQDVYLFQGSIAENIAYGNDSVNIEAIIAAAKKAQLHDFVSTLPDGYATLVGERGIKLSGGQRQRLSIARALLKDAPILVLDEATSSVDTETEEAIQRHLKDFTKNRTAIIIAHRLSTIRHADHIVVLKDGQVDEEGQHDDLIKNDSSYARLWGIQTGERGITTVTT